MSVVEQVVAVLVDLPDEQQTAVLDFVEFLRQKKHLSLTLESTPQGSEPDLESMRETLRQVVGCAKNSPTDLSTNPDYLEGFGQ